MTFVFAGASSAMTSSTVISSRSASRSQRLRLSAQFSVVRPPDLNVPPAFTLNRNSVETEPSSGGSASPSPQPRSVIWM